MKKLQKKKPQAKAKGKGERLCDCVEKSVKRYLRDMNGADTNGVYQMVLDQVEKPLLEVVMQHTERNQTKASRVLGINRNTLRKKLQSHGLED